MIEKLSPEEKLSDEEREFLQTLPYDKLLELRKACRLELERRYLPEQVSFIYQSLLSLLSDKKPSLDKEPLKEWAELAETTKVKFKSAWLSALRDMDVLRFDDGEQSRKMIFFLMQRSPHIEKEGLNISTILVSLKNMGSVFDAAFPRYRGSNAIEVLKKQLEFKNI